MHRTEDEKSAVGSNVIRSIHRIGKYSVEVVPVRIFFCQLLVQSAHSQSEIVKCEF